MAAEAHLFACYTHYLSVRTMFTFQGTEVTMLPL